MRVCGCMGCVQEITSNSLASLESMDGVGRGKRWKGKWGLGHREPWILG